ncbi:MAG: hypothetical protein IPK69_10700 [Phycisphaerales bacterium]|nr:MAG: hypothetical protein IPK69_10700 [Phycisphaerales bacterium]
MDRGKPGPGQVRSRWSWWFITRWMIAGAVFQVVMAWHLAWNGDAMSVRMRVPPPGTREVSNAPGRVIRFLTLARECVERVSVERGVPNLQIVVAWSTNRGVYSPTWTITRYDDLNAKVSRGRLETSWEPACYLVVEYGFPMRGLAVDMPLSWRGPYEAGPGADDLRPSVPIDEIDPGGTCVGLWRGGLAVEESRWPLPTGVLPLGFLVNSFFHGLLAWSALTGTVHFVKWSHQRAEEQRRQQEERRRLGGVVVRLVPHCPECRYEVRGLVIDEGYIRCPECGHLHRAEMEDDEVRVRIERIDPSFR